jgi:hypothetical protein
VVSEFEGMIASVRRRRGPVPYTKSHRQPPEYRCRAAAGGLRNFGIFDFALNGVE